MRRDGEGWRWIKINEKWMRLDKNRSKNRLFDLQIYKPFKSPCSRLWWTVHHSGEFLLEVGLQQCVLLVVADSGLLHQGVVGTTHPHGVPEGMDGIWRLYVGCTEKMYIIITIIT